MNMGISLPPLPLPLPLPLPAAFLPPTLPLPPLDGSEDEERVCELVEGLTGELSSVNPCRSDSSSLEGRLAVPNMPWLVAAKDMVVLLLLCPVGISPIGYGALSSLLLLL
jgi:hypothetical protein